MTIEAEFSSLWRCGDDELLAAMLGAERERRLIEARMLALLGEVNNRKLAAAKGYASAQQLLCELLNISRVEATRRLACADEATASPGIGGVMIAPALPASGAALAEGAISVEHVEVISKFRSSLPRWTAAEVWEPAEKVLADLARGVDPAALRRLADTELRARLDLDGALAQELELAQPTRRLELHRRGNGCGWGNFELDAEPFSQLETLRSALSAPKPTGTGVPDTRSIDERRGDGLAEIVNLAASNAERPTEGCDKPQITVTIRWEDLRPDRQGNQPALLGANHLPLPASPPAGSPAT
ncbi:MAG: DUF222 domain-containing protein, partial [Sciscionella sp.]